MMVEYWGSPDLVDRELRGKNTSQVAMRRCLAH